MRIHTTDTFKRWHFSNYYMLLIMSIKCISNFCGWPVKWCKNLQKNQTISLPQRENVAKEKKNLQFLFSPADKMHHKFLNDELNIFNNLKRSANDIGWHLCVDDYRLSRICLFIQHTLWRFAPKIQLINSNSTVLCWRNDFYLFSCIYAVDWEIFWLWNHSMNLNNNSDSIKSI